MSACRTALNWLLAPLAIVLASSAVVGSAKGVDSLAGSQGIDTSLPLTNSAVTVAGRGRFENLEVTVNQTENLTSQAISITWEGGEPTTQGPGRFGSNYLQIFQCWGDDDGTVPGNPGPPPEQCVQGAIAGAPGVNTAGLPNGFTATRLISREGWDNFNPSLGAVDPITKNLWLPFRAVDGVEVPIQVNPAYSEANQSGNFWLNPFYGIATTNEVVAAVTKEDGTGAELMQVLTGVESSGIGCGQTVQPATGGGKKVPQCWIVVVPRGTPVDENAGTPFAVNADQAGVSTSPVAPQQWKNRIAVPINFNAVDTACSFGVDERRLSGNEFVIGAVSSWQPILCGEQQLPPFSYAVVGDGLARQQLARASAGSAGMVVVSRPLAPEASPASNPVVYAPLSLSGVTIGFNFERVPRFTAPDDAQRLTGVRVADMNLTPRLVAKLLTQSYGSQVTIYEAPDYDWLPLNPTHLANDPDFLQFNPEFVQLEVGNPRNFGGLALPTGNSDAAFQVWEWILADPEAKAWLDGEADEWGMVVNPVYATTAERNSTGAAFGTPVPSSFPKGDPYCFNASPRGPGNSIVPPALCGTDWSPYTRGFAESAIVARQAYDGARLVENPFALTASDVWKRDVPQTIGRRSMLSMTDTASAAQFGLQTARLSRAGDDGDDREFVKPDAQGLLNGVGTMASKSAPGFLEPAPEGDASASGAYPLTVLTYAATKPLALDQPARADYATFVDFAATTGQQPGLEPGRLPRGYVPLPAELAAQATAAANEVRTLQPPSLASRPVAQETRPSATPQTATPQTSPTQTSATQTSATQTSATQTIPSQTSPSQTSPSQTSPSQASPSQASPTQTRTTSPRVPSTSPTAAPAVPAAEVPPAEGSVERVDSEPAVTAGDEPEVTGVASLVATPLLALGRSRYAVAGLGVVSLLSLLGALEISKRPRRAIVQDPSGTSTGGVSA